MQKALDEQAIPYEVVAGPRRPRNRTDVIEGTGQPLYPAIQLESGDWYREESKEMARTIREGRLPGTHHPASAGPRVGVTLERDDHGRPGPAR